LSGLLKLIHTYAYHKYLYLGCGVYQYKKQHFHQNAVLFYTFARNGSSNNDNNGYSSYSFYNLQVGDIIVFKAPEEDHQDDRRKTIVHRVAEIIQTDDTSNYNKSSSRVIRTKVMLIRLQYQKLITLLENMITLAR